MKSLHVCTKHTFWDLYACSNHSNNNFHFSSCQVGLGYGAVGNPPLDLSGFLFIASTECPLQVSMAVFHVFFRCSTQNPGGGSSFYLKHCYLELREKGLVNYGLVLKLTGISTHISLGQASQVAKLELNGAEVYNSVGGKPEFLVHSAKLYFAFLIVCEIETWALIASRQHSVSFTWYTRSHVFSTRSLRRVLYRFCSVPPGLGVPADTRQGLTR